MPKLIPDKIKNDVLTQWLLGIPQEQISIDNDISTGTVSAIASASRASSTADVEKIRYLSIFLKNNNISPGFFGSSIRLKNILQRLELSEEQLESFIEKLGVHCFKKQLSIEEFILQINKICDTADSFACSIPDMPKILNEEYQEINRLDDEILLKHQKISDLIKEFKITVEDLSEYRNTRPIANKIVELRKEIDKKDDIIWKLEFELFVAKMDLGMEKYLRTHPKEAKECEDMRKEENI